MMGDLLTLATLALGLAALVIAANGDDLLAISVMAAGGGSILAIAYIVSALNSGTDLPGGGNTREEQSDADHSDTEETHV